MGSREEIGALLGFVAFAGLAVLVFLTFQQARHIRRLRDWAGRAPERAAADLARVEAGADEKTIAAPGATGLETADTGPSRLERLREGFADRWAELDRRSPVSPRIILGGLAAVILGIAIATSGFGLFGGEESDAGAAREKPRKGGGGGAPKEEKLEVAVLNGTAPEGGTGVVGIADRVGNDVEAEGFELGAVENAGEGSYPASVVMYLPGEDEAAVEVADSLEAVLGPTETAEMTPEIEQIAGGASVALIVGQDDAGI